MVDFAAVLIVFVVILFSVILHELAHGWVAYALGDRTAKDAGRLTLNPLKHIDPMMSIVVPLLLYIVGAPIMGGAKPVPINSKNLKGGAWGMALVAVAGPLTNFLLALLGFLIGHFSGFLYSDGYLGVFFSELVLANLGFFVFNLIPIPPLDGSRVLYAISPDKVREWLEKIEPYGIIVIYILLVFTGVYSNFATKVISSIFEGFVKMVS